MTRECEEVVNAVGFATEIRTVERFLCRCSPRAFIALVCRKDPQRDHDAQWFAPFIDNGYLHQHDIECSFSQDFWWAYSVFDSLCQFSVHDFPLIDEMSRSRDRLRLALQRSRVVNVRYVYKVFEGLPEVKRVNNLYRVQQEYTSSVKKTVNL